MKNVRKGFTLIELLVVISIIGVLATIVLGSLNDARSSARDAQRKRDIKTIQTALEIYHLDKGQYPVSNNGIHTYQDSWSTFLDGVVLPIDPLDEGTSPTSGGYSYRYQSRTPQNYCDHQAYILVYNLENEDGNSVEDGITLCDGSASPTYGNAFVVGVSPRE